MNLFDLLAPSPVHDEVLGPLRRGWSGWRGAIVLERSRSIPLVLSGSRAGPAPAALALAHQLHHTYQQLKPVIGAALLEAMEPVRSAPDLPHAVQLALPRPGDAEAVWRLVTPVHVLIEPLEGTLTTEIGLRADWDEEHTLGARLQDGRLVELNGSVRGI
jgi:hypothetical protein